MALRLYGGPPRQEVWLQAALIAILGHSYLMGLCIAWYCNLSISLQKSNTPKLSSRTSSMSTDCCRMA